LQKLASNVPSWQQRLKSLHQSRSSPLGYLFFQSGNSSRLAFQPEKTKPTVNGGLLHFAGGENVTEFEPKTLEGVGNHRARK
jgi:hypothetical protein